MAKKTKIEVQYPIHSVWNQKVRWFSLIALIGFVLLAYALLNDQPTRTYWQIGDVILYLIATSLVLLAAFSLFVLKSYEITENEIIVRNYFYKKRRSIPRQAITSWHEIENEDKNGNITSKSLTLHCKPPHKRIKMDSTYFVNYGTLKKVLTKGISKNEKAEESVYRFWSIGIGLLFLCFGFLLLPNFGKKPVLSKSDFEYVEGQLVQHRITSSGRKHKTYHLEIGIAEYPEFTFKMNDDVWVASELNRVNQALLTGENIKLAIKKVSYDKKIKRTTPLTFWDKHSGYYGISFYGIYKSSEMLLPLSYTLPALQEPKDNWNLGFDIVILLLFWGFAILLFYLGFANRTKAKSD